MTTLRTATRVAGALLLAFVLSTWTACGGDDADLTTGTLNFSYQIGSTQRAERHCRMVDLRAQLHRMEVSNGEIAAGAEDTLEWHDVYVGTGADSLMSSVDIEALELPVGTYSNYGFTWGRPMAWIVDCDGDSVEFPGTMFGDDYPDSTRKSINNANGCWGYDESGNFELLAAGETAGAFDILPGEATSVLWRMNLEYVDWDDADDDGVWDEGESYDFVNLAGTTTMFDVIVTY